MNTGQTVYEQLQEIYEKIADKTLSFGCRIKSKAYGYVTLTEIFDCTCDDILQYKRGEKAPHGEPLYLRYKLYSGNVGLDDIEEIIGHPISLSIVLSAFWGFAIGVPSYIDENIVLSLKHNTKSNFKLTRKLLTDAGSDAILDDQSDETIEALHKLLVRK